MGKFEEKVRAETPRLAIEFRRGPNGEELFQWGLQGDMPAVKLIGALARIQAEVFFKAGEPCPVLALAVVWDAERGEFDWYLHPDVPLDSLAGMIEVAKMTLVAAHTARRANATVSQAGARGPLLGPDGQPMRRG